MTTELEADAKEAAILDMLDSFRARMTDAEIDVLLRAVEPYGAAAVKRACQRFSADEVKGHNSSFAPNAVQLVAEVKWLDELLQRTDAPKLVAYPMGGAPPAGFIALGPLESEVAGRRVDMRNMHPREKEAVLAGQGLPPPNKKLPRDVIKPRLQRMQGNG